MKHCCVYITTNANRTVLYTGVTNDLERRLIEHREGSPTAFTSRYGAWHLVYFEEFPDPDHAIEREKQIKGWVRKKKIELIESQNPYWKFLNPEE